MNKNNIKKYIKLMDTKLGKALKPLPPLPKNTVAWLTDYLWVLTAIGAVLVSMSVISLFYAISAYMNFVGNFSAYQGFYTHSAYGSLWMLSTVIAIGFALLVAYLLFKAIAPLHQKKAYGWNLLLIVFLVSGVEIVVNAVLSLSVFQFISTIIISGIFYAIGAYFLYQVKPHFVKTHKN